MTLPKKIIFRSLFLMTLLKPYIAFTQTYVYDGKLGQAPAFKRAEKFYSDYSVCDLQGCIEYKNKHLGFTSFDTVDDYTLEKNEYTYVEIRTKYIEAINNKQILSGMNYAEVLAVRQPYYKFVSGNTEKWFFHYDATVQFKNGVVN